MTAKVYVPDVLETISQLPNDDVFTPPGVANDILDLLPNHVWSEPNYTWLDPGTKSGVFLREAAKRLMSGLAAWEPHAGKRREHIYRNMLYGCATTQLTGEVARRSLYHSMDATGSGLKDEHLKNLIVRFGRPEGNIAFPQTDHEFIPGRRSCIHCGSAPDIERGPTRENYAHPFIHGTYPTEELSEMKFDVIVGNPPYQLKGGGGGTNDSPIYHYFVERAIDMDPRYVVMITPSRWFTGGRGLGEFRERMLADRRLKQIVDNPKLFDVFPGVEIKGGVSYFLWSRDHEGDCEFSTRIEGEFTSQTKRDLRDGQGVVVRDNVAAPIVEKVVQAKDGNISHRISPDTPFGLATNFSEFYGAPSNESVRLYKRGLKDAWVNRARITKNEAWLDALKVMLPEAGDGHGRTPAIVLGPPFVAETPSACTQTFIVAGSWPNTRQAENFAAYIRTKFVRFLVFQRKVSQHTRPNVFKFVPDLPMDRAWTDELLYERYNLTQDEITYIESQIKPMDADGA